MEQAGTELSLTLGDGRTVSIALEHLPEHSRPVHPTQIYSSVNALLLCLLTLAIYPFRRRHGQVIALLLTLYAATRFLLEIIRTDEGGFLANLTISQNVSIVIALAMLAMWIYVQRQPTIGPARPVGQRQDKMREQSEELSRPSPRPRVTNVVNEDTQLIDQTLAGDAAAFEQLVRRHQDRLFNTLCHTIGNREEAEDVVQDTFVQAYTKLQHFQQRSSFYTWIYRIAHNLWVSRRRRRRPHMSVELGRELTGKEPTDGLESPVQQLERQERIQLIRTALAALGDEARAILVLREMDGCCYESIAELLDVPLGTVRSRLHRARLQLKRKLEEVLEEQA